MKLDQIPESWKEVLADEFTKPYFKQPRRSWTTSGANISSRRDEVFSALEATPYDMSRCSSSARPVSRRRPAHGMCFSSAWRLPPSLVNISRNCTTPRLQDAEQRHLMPWARQGVLLLNAV
jgi:uracil-DNA glycosylase